MHRDIWCRMRCTSATFVLKEQTFSSHIFFVSMSASFVNFWLNISMYSQTSILFFWRTLKINDCKSVNSVSPLYLESVQLVNHFLCCIRKKSKYTRSVKKNPDCTLFLENYTVYSLCCWAVQSMHLKVLPCYVLVHISLNCYSFLQTKK